MNNNFDFGLNDYPIFNEAYRDTLNQKILYHYYENEIGFETAALFKFYLNNKMNEIMDYYNIMYSVQRKMLEQDMIIGNVNLKETYTGKNKSDGKSSSSSDSESNTKNLYQDTPQGKIYQGTIDNMEYATDLTLNKANASGTSESSSNSTSDSEYVKLVTGNNGSIANVDILYKVKKNIMNIDMMIINDLSDLFMQIY